MTTRTRGRRTLAPLALPLGLIVGGCAGGGDGPDKADAPATGTPAAAEGSVATAPGGAQLGQPGQPGQPGTAIAAGGAATGPGAATGGSATATGGSPGSPGIGAGGQVIPGGAPTGGSAAATGPSVAADPAAPGAGSGPPSSGSSSSNESTTPPAGGASATPEQCAALNQALAIIDHPDLRALKVQTGC